MNFNILKKKNKNCVRVEWSDEIFDSIQLTDFDLETIMITLIDFEKKKSVKDIVLANYKNTPIYIVIKRDKVQELLDYLLSKFTQEEKYELCHQINLIRYDYSK
jgi:hypothetical protein